MTASKNIYPAENIASIERNNIKRYGWWRCSMIARSLFLIKELRPRSVLEIGPGNYILRDCLVNTGVPLVETINLMDDGRTTYVGDIRKPDITTKKYDVVCAFEVFEHCNFKYLPSILDNINNYLADDGHLIISLPFHSLDFRISKRRTFHDHCFFVTNIPQQRKYDLLYPLRVAYRLFIKKLTFKEVVNIRFFPELPDDEYEEHHWDLGHRPTLPSRVEKTLQQTFDLIYKLRDKQSTKMYYVLQKRRS